MSFPWPSPNHIFSPPFSVYLLTSAHLVTSELRKVAYISSGLLKGGWAPHCHPRPWKKSYLLHQQLTACRSCRRMEYLGTQLCGLGQVLPTAVRSSGTCVPGRWCSASLTLPQALPARCWTVSVIPSLSALLQPNSEASDRRDLRQEPFDVWFQRLQSSWSGGHSRSDHGGPRVWLRLLTSQPTRRPSTHEVAGWKRKGLPKTHRPLLLDAFMASIFPLFTLS